MERVNGFEPLLQTAVTVVDGVAVGLRQCLRSKEERICCDGGTGREAQSAFDAEGELAVLITLLGSLDEFTRRYDNFL